MRQGNLVLSRKQNERVVIDLRQFGLGVIDVSIVQIRGDKVRTAYNGDRSIPIHRGEVFDKIERERAA